MKKLVTGVAAAAMMMASAALAVEVDLTVDVASAYVFRGVTFNDGFVVQPGLEVALPAGLSLGVWSNFDLEDYDGAVEKNQFSEVSFDVAYSLPVDLLDISIGYTEYTFPGAEGDADREIGIAFGYDFDFFEVELGLFYGVDGGIEKDFYAELGIGTSYEIADGLDLDLGAAVGYLNPDEGESGFSAFVLDAGLSYGIVGASVTYYGQIDSDVLPDGPGAYDVEVVGMLSLALSF